MARGDAAAQAGPVRPRPPGGGARRQDLLARITDDVVTHGLADFSLRGAARASATTHKVLLYHFGSVEELLAAVVGELRARRVLGGLLASAATGSTLTERVRVLWPALTGAEADAL